MSGAVERQQREYKQLELRQLEHDPNRRDIRQSVVDRIKGRIEESGYNPAKTMRVFERDGFYEVVDGNHRLQALQQLDKGGSFTVPCTVEPNDADPVTVSIESNRDEDTFAEQDLFDYLDRIEQLRDEHTQAEIGEKLGWSRAEVNHYTRLLDKVDTEVRDMARKHQAGRVSEDDTTVSFNFTEGWFRNSGIYELKNEFQAELMEWFCEEKNCNTSQNQVQKQAETLQDIQAQIKRLDERLNPGVEDQERQSLEESVRDGEHTENSLRDAIQKLNSEAKNQAHFGSNAIEKLPDVPANSVDCVVMDPPYGTEYTSHRDTDNPEFGQDLDATLTLLRDVFEQLDRVCKANAHIYMFFPMNKYEDIVPLARRYFEVTDVPLIWAKNNHAPTRDAESGFDKMYAHKYEPILVCRMPKGKERELNGGACANVLEHDVPKKDDRWHDSQKPIPLAEELIANCTGAKATVLDPFAGSGSTLLAAKKADRHYIGIEKDDSHESRFKREARKYE